MGILTNKDKYLVSFTLFVLYAVTAILEIASYMLNWGIDEDFLYYLVGVCIPAAVCFVVAEYFKGKLNGGKK